jgi:membrane fusion protein, multidrug efflux system
MQSSNRWILILAILACLQLTACKHAASPVSASKPAEIVAIEGTDRNQLILTEDAVTRLAIETSLVSEEQIVRKRIVGGQVEALPEMNEADLNKVLVRVSINTADVDDVLQAEPAIVLPLLEDENAVGLTAQPVEMPAVSDEDITTSLFYQVDNNDQKLVPGQMVRVELSLVGNDSEQVVIPYAAVVYGMQGETWTYTNPSPQTYVLQAISIDYISGDVAILSEGPSAGTQVVTAGAAELYGTEFGVGK